MSAVADKRAAFRKLHETGCFVIPNPWDVGSAVYLAHLGFKALASTSSGFAWSQGRADEAVPVDTVLAHLARLAAAVTVPVNADFENGYADAPEGVAANVRRAVETGIAGLSIEDSTRGGAAPLYPLPLAVARVRAARAAIDASAGNVVLTARTEGFIRDAPDLDEAVRRLVAYAEAGADCLYAPGLRNAADVSAVVKAVAPKPVNVLVTKPGFTVAELSALGVRRVSLGGALARAAWGGFMRAAEEIAKEGTFDALAEAAAGKVLNDLFGARGK